MSTTATASTPARPQADGPHFSPVRVYAVGVLVCAGLTAGAYVLGVEPALARQAEQESLLADLDTRQARIAALNGSAERARRDLAAARQAMADLPLHLLPADRINQRLAQLTDLAGEVALTLHEVRPGSTAAAADYQTVSIHVAGVGTYPACAAFLHRLHRDFPDTAVQSFTTAGTGTDGTAEFRFDLTWHTAPLPK